MRVWQDGGEVTFTCQYDDNDRLTSMTRLVVAEPPQASTGGGGNHYAAVVRPSRHAGGILKGLGLASLGVFLVPLLLVRSAASPLGRRARRRRIVNGTMVVFLALLMLIGPENVYALHADHLLYQALGPAAFGAVGDTQITTYAYDAAGNMIRETRGGVSNDYVYDAENRLRQAAIRIDLGTEYQKNITYTYDADGIRTSKTATIGTNPDTATHTATYYVVDKNRDYAQVLAEWTAQWTGQTAPGPQTDTLAVTYRYGHDLIHQTRDPLTTPVTHYFHYDGQLSTRHLTNSPADPLTNPPQVTDSYTYGAYGELLSTPGPTTNNYLYAGEQLDPDLGAASTPGTGSPAGLYYLRARYYSPAQGRFTGRDSFQGVQQAPTSLHKYLYANANPIWNRDPSGMMSTNMLNTMVWMLRLTLALLFVAEVAIIVYLKIYQPRVRRAAYQAYWAIHAGRAPVKPVQDAVAAMWAHWPKKKHWRMNQLALQLNETAAGAGVLWVRVIPDNQYVEGQSIGMDLFVSETAMQGNALELAMAIYCEWEHHEAGGDMSESEAEQDLRRIRNTIPAAERTPYIDRLEHKKKYW